MDRTTNKACQIAPSLSDIHSSDFDPDFVWGVSTSAYQIEGAAFEGGRGPSVWDAFCLRYPGRINGGDNGNNACRAYYRTKEDVQIMKKLGIKAYRFSLSWSRILPGGKLHMGINREGVDYYNNLIDELLANDIEPYVTLFHWDTPNALEDLYMGFLSEEIICDFTIYAEFCFWEFGDRVKHWTTINEPHSYSAKGYAIGSYPPGRGGDQSEPGNAATEPYIVGHNMLLAHASVVKLYRENFQECQRGEIGITLNTRFFEPLNPERQDDIDAALRMMDFMFGWFMEPLFSGKYPDTMIQNVTNGRLPEFTEEQSKLVKGSYDFIGFNYYVSKYATTAQPTNVVSYVTDCKVLQQPYGLDGKLIGPKGGTDDFYSYPPGLHKALLRIKDNYGDPIIYVTENGWPDKDDTITLEEARVDTERILYYNLHFQSLRDAISDGVRVKAYFAWSLMDNFEWNEGYSARFGLIFIDYKSGKFERYPKHSAFWFKNFLSDQKKPKPKTKNSLMGSRSIEISKRRTKL